MSMDKYYELCGKTNGKFGSYTCNLPKGHDGDHAQLIFFASWSDDPRYDEEVPR